MENLQNLNISQILPGTPIHYLDTVLKYLATRASEASLQVWEVYKGLEREGFKFTESGVSIILDKIVKDEFAGVYKGSSSYFFKITFEGLVFYEQGGYRKRLLKDSFSARQEELNKMNQKILFWFTGIVAVGTFIAAIYYIIQIWIFFHKS